MKDIFEKLLHELGLGEKERSVYKLILEQGKIAPARIARLAGINRTTVYSVAQELKSKGLIVEDLGGKTLYYLPARQEEIEKVIKREQEKMVSREKVLRDLQDALKSMPESVTYALPKIRYVDELDLEEYLYEATPRWHESALANNTTWWGFQDHTFVEQFEKWIVWFWRNAPEPINLKLFSNQAPAEVRMKVHDISRRQIRFWEGESNITGTQWIVGSYIISIVTSQRPYYLVEIHDAVLAHNMREVFKKLWEK